MKLFRPTRDQMREHAMRKRYTPHVEELISRVYTAITEAADRGETCLSHNPLATVRADEAELEIVWNYLRFFGRFGVNVSHTFFRISWD